MFLISKHFAKKYVVVTRRLINIPTVTALKHNCPWVSWLSPAQLSCCPFEKKWTEIMTSHEPASKGLFFFFRETGKIIFQADSDIFTKLVGILHWSGDLLLLHPKLNACSGFLSHLGITTAGLLPGFCTCCLHMWEYYLLAVAGTGALCSQDVILSPTAGKVPSEPLLPPVVVPVKWEQWWCSFVLLHPGTMSCCCSKWAHFPRKRKVIQEQ